MVRGAWQMACSPIMRIRRRTSVTPHSDAGVVLPSHFPPSVRGIHLNNLSNSPGPAQFARVRGAAPCRVRQAVVFSRRPTSGLPVPMVAVSTGRSGDVALSRAA